MTDLEKLYNATQDAALILLEARIQEKNQALEVGAEGYREELAARVLRSSPSAERAAGAEETE